MIKTARLKTFISVKLNISVISIWNLNYQSKDWPIQGIITQDVNLKTISLKSNLKIKILSAKSNKIPFFDGCPVSCIHRNAISSPFVSSVFTIVLNLPVIYKSLNVRKMLSFKLLIDGGDFRNLSSDRRAVL